MPLSIPVTVTKRPGYKTPLLDTTVRRRSRLNPLAKDGYQIVKIREPAPKKRRTAVKIDLDTPPQDVADAVNPIPLDTLQEWGVNCGVAPEELSEDALMQGRHNDQEY